MVMTAPTTGVVVPFNAAAMTITVISGTGYPDGTDGLFVIEFDPGTVIEEQVLMESRTDRTFTVAPDGRGYGGTIPVSHNSGTANVKLRVL
jgi:hypothetical protein